LTGEVATGHAKLCLSRDKAYFNMPGQLKIATSAPLAVVTTIEQLGKRLRLARQRRRIKLRDLAARAGVAYETARAAEHGALSSSIAVYVALAWAMGLEHEFGPLLDPDRDSEGLTLERSRVPERVRGPTTSNYEDQF